MELNPVMEKMTNNYKLYEDNGIVHLIIHEDTSLQYEEVKDIEACVKSYLHNKKYLKLFDARAAFQLEQKAKSFLESPRVKGRMQALAVLLGSYTHQQIIDLFVEMNSTKLPVKIFVNYDEAVKWLSSFSKSENNI